jgi:hypothetical protein
VAGDFCPWRIQGIRTLRMRLLRGLLLGTLLLLAGCATGRITGETYRDFDHGYEVRLPPVTWIPRQLEHATLSFESPQLKAGMALLTDCRTPEPGELLWVARHLFFGLQEKRIHEQESIRLHDAGGIRTRLQARLDEVPVEVEGVTIRRAGCLYDFIYVAPPATFPQGRLDFEGFVKSWTPLTEQ